MRPPAILRSFAWRLGLGSIALGLVACGAGSEQGGPGMGADVAVAGAGGEGSAGRGTPGEGNPAMLPLDPGLAGAGGPVSADCDGLGYGVLPNGRGGVNYEQVCYSSAMGF